MRETLGGLGVGFNSKRLADVLVKSWRGITEKVVMDETQAELEPQSKKGITEESKGSSKGEVTGVATCKALSEIEKVLSQDWLEMTTSLSWLEKKAPRSNMSVKSGILIGLD